MFVLFGSGPGIGLATAKLFASHSFDKIFLISRNAQRLQEDRKAVIQAAEADSRKVDVFTSATDLADTNALQTTLSEVEKFGKVECVLFNAARVGPSELFKFDESAITQDFLVSCLNHRMKLY